jgi:hypothetical protein
MSNRVSGVRMLDSGLGLGLMILPALLLLALYAWDNYYWRFATGAKDKTYLEWLRDNS